MNISRKQKIIILMFVDSMSIFFSSIIAHYFMAPYVSISSSFEKIALFTFIGVYLFFGFVFNVFTRINRFTNLREIIGIFGATTTTFFGVLLICQFWGEEYSKRLVFFMYLSSLLLIVSSRLVWRLMIEQKAQRAGAKNKSKNTLIIGAGDGGRILINSLAGSIKGQEMNLIGVIDDDKDKQNTYISNVKIIGTTKELPMIIKEYSIEMVTIAIPSLKKKELERIVAILKPLNVKVTTIPSIEEIASGELEISKIRDVDVIDLLGREEVRLDMDSIKGQLTDKVILVTGAGGSIGSEICRQVMRFNPKKILLLGHGENSIYLIEKELKRRYFNKETEIVALIADVQDRSRIFDIMNYYRPEIVYHAAAHKHVPLMESNPSESLKNNVYGTLNVAEAAKENNVQNFVMVSTDKAVNPPNVMGATKRIAEMIVMGLNEEGKTKFSAVRFGNVLGSRGSVIPVFKEQIANGGPLTVTDFRMTRYFMTIPEASRLVIQAGALARGREIFILDMGHPVKIVDLARRMIELSGYSENEIKIVESGIRPGEKLYEELLVEKEKNPKQVFDKIFIGNVKGFSYSDVLRFVESLSMTDTELSRKIIRFANDSSK